MFCLSFSFLHFLIFISSFLFTIFFNCILNNRLLCHVMSFYVMLRYVMLLCHVMSCPVTLRYAVMSCQCHVMVCYVMLLCHVMLC